MNKTSQTTPKRRYKFLRIMVATLQAIGWLSLAIFVLNGIPMFLDMTKVKVIEDRHIALQTFYVLLTSGGIAILSFVMAAVISLMCDVASNIQEIANGQLVDNSTIPVKRTDDHSQWVPKN